MIRASGGLIERKSRRSVSLAISPRAPGELDAGRAAADDDERHPLARGARATCSRSAASNAMRIRRRISRGVVDRLEARRESRPLVVPEVRVPGARRDDERVVGDRAAVGQLDLAALAGRARSPRRAARSCSGCGGGCCAAAGRSRPGASAPVATWYSSGWKRWWLRRSTSVRSIAVVLPEPARRVQAAESAADDRDPVALRRLHAAIFAERRALAAARRLAGSANLRRGARRPGMDLAGVRSRSGGRDRSRRARPSVAEHASMSSLSPRPAGARSQPLEERPVDAGDLAEGPALVAAEREQRPEGLALRRPGVVGLEVAAVRGVRLGLRSGTRSRGRRCSGAVRLLGATGPGWRPARSRSYSARRRGSPRTSHASLMRFIWSASPSTSGWKMRASTRYAAWITRGFAAGSTCRTR